MNLLIIKLKENIIFCGLLVTFFDILISKQILRVCKMLQIENATHLKLIYRKIAFNKSLNFFLCSLKLKYR